MYQIGIVIVEIEPYDFTFIRYTVLVREQLLLQVIS